MKRFLQIAALPLAAAAILCLAVATIAQTTNPPSIRPVDGTPVDTTTTVATNDYNVAVTDQFVEVLASNKSITLPSSGLGSASGCTYIIKNMSPHGTNTILATSLLDGSSSYTMTNQYATVHVRSDGATWSFVSKYATP